MPEIQKPRTQKFREVALSAPPGEEWEILLLRSLSGTEQLGRLFHYELELLSENPAVKYEDMLGQNVTIELTMSGGRTRYLNGYISRFMQTGRLGRVTQYRATIVPWLWFLTRTSDCRIFQEMKVPDIIKKIFRDRGFADFDDRLSGTYRQWEYCVQYRETDFNFVSRLMEQEGIYYYFTHENEKHTLVLADARSSHDPFPGYEEIPFRPFDQAFTKREYIWDWTMEYTVQPGAYALNDYDFTAPKKDLRATKPITRQHAASDYKVYDYPGEYTEYSDGENYANTRIEELQAQHEVVRAQSDARGIFTGCTFQLTDHPRQDQCREYLITSVSYQLESDEFDSSGQPLGRGPVYSCALTAIDAKQPFRSARITPKPVVQGPQTAFVVGRSDQEIYTDKYGQVKVQFHWDRYGKSDENSSCWIRVSQAWAGKDWGAMCIPRIGQEVIVEFLEGDPDHPIITGRVYNAQSMPPYSLPDNKTQAGIKSRSSKGGSGENFNEIRLEDKKGSEEVYIHAEKDMNTVVEANETLAVGGNRMKTVGGDETIIVKGNRMEVVGVDEDCTVGGDWKERVLGNRHLLVETDHFETVKNRHTHIKGDHYEKVDGMASRMVGQYNDQKVGTNMAVEAGENIHLKAGMNVVIEAGVQLTLKVGGNFISIDPTGVAIQGTMVLINSGGAPGSGKGANPLTPTDAEPAKLPGEDHGEGD
jgi:type VI secretion system secreted protein VgrG